MHLQRRLTHFDVFIRWFFGGIDRWSSEFSEMKSVGFYFCLFGRDFFLGLLFLHDLRAKKKKNLAQRE